MLKDLARRKEVRGGPQRIKERRHQKLRTRIPASVPRLVRDSPLMRKGGFQLFEQASDSHALRRMQSEAQRLLAKADRVDLSRGGIPRRWLRAFGGKAQFSFYHGRRTLALLHNVTGAAVVPTGRFGSYLYYTRPGDHFAIHRDPNTKHHVLLITCVADSADSSEDGGMFCVYPNRLSEKIWAIRATPDQGAVKFRLRPGQSLALFGRWVPHAVIPIGSGQKRIVSVLCYKFALKGRSREKERK